MKTRLTRLFGTLALLALSILDSQFSAALAQGTAFTYQGRLNAGGSPANGAYDITFNLYGTSSGGSAVTGPVTNLNTAVSNGLFMASVDFGGAFAIAPETYWLDIQVAPSGSGNFTELSPRQQITPAPYALYAEEALTSESVAANSVSAVDLQTVSSPSPGQVLLNVGGGLLGWTNLPSGGGSGGWSLTGNAGTTPGVNFLGTTDQNPLEFQVQGNLMLFLDTDFNFVAGRGQVVSGASYGAIGGGYGNNLDGFASAIAGGDYNTVTGTGATVGGGEHNQATVSDATVAGGFQNSAMGVGAAVGGGGNDGTTIGGNTANGAASTVAGGMVNLISSFGSYGFVGGGSNNAVWGLAGSLCGGLNNQVGTSGFAATIGGGAGNQVSAAGSFIGGGGYDGFEFSPNLVSGNASAIVGGTGNQVSGYSGFIGGGFSNLVSKYAATVVAGAENTASGYGSFVGGGGYDGNTYVPNVAAGNAGTIGGGGLNSISVFGIYGVIGGGWANTNEGFAAAVGGGQQNRAIGADSFVGGGNANTAGGMNSVVAGGSGNNANGSGSFAAGVNATANGNNTFVWGDGSRAAADQGNNTFNVLATGGIYLYTTTIGTDVVLDNSGNLDFGTATRQMLNLYGSTYGIGVQASDEYFRTAGQFYWYQGGAHNNANGNAGGGTTLMSLNTSGLTVNGTFVSASDRNLKENFQPINPEQVLERVSALPISKWNYKQDAGTEHIGPMAQDFYAAFSVGPDDKHITTVDESGVALAAIQGLNQKLEAENTELKARLNELEATVKVLAERK